MVFVGRWSHQKGVDLIADVAEWLVTTHPCQIVRASKRPQLSFRTFAELGKFPQRCCLTVCCHVVQYENQPQ